MANAWGCLTRAHSANWAASAPGLVSPKLSQRMGWGHREKQVEVKVVVEDSQTTAISTCLSLNLSLSLNLRKGSHTERAPKREPF